jgi:uncharacterized protein (DUF427 family)
MKTPGPDHPISIAANPKRVRVTLAGHVVADTTRALTLREASLRPMQYIPRADVDMSVLERTAHSTYCPYKGHASYYSVKVGERSEANAVWTYETPYPAMREITELLAFYPSKVDGLEEIDR